MWGDSDYSEGWGQEPVDNYLNRRRLEIEDRIYRRRYRDTTYNITLKKDEKSLTQEKIPNFGISFESIQDIDKKNLTIFNCPICFKLVNNPKQCIKCDSIFCSICINQQISKGQNKCPFKCPGSFETIKLNRHLKEQLMKISIKCPFNCGEIIMYEQVEKHFLCCKETKKYCKNSGCSYIGEDIEKHAKNCDFLLMKCELCKENVLKKDKAKHDERECKETEMTCNICKCKMKREKYNKHNGWGEISTECLSNQLRRKKALLRKYKKLYRKELARNGRKRRKIVIKKEIAIKKEKE